MTDTAPRLFISYSWSSPAHQEWVIELATRLVNNGVDVILDRWELREGHDSIHFMEKMVTDPSVTHVVMISDESYAKKADDRSGGVGTETTIISKNVYEAQGQEKFVVVIPPGSGDGKVHVPAYYTGRIYIDLSTEEKYADQFETLLRWLFNKRLYVKPALGERPTFLADDVQLALGTEVQLHRAEDAIRSGRSYAVPAVEEFFEKFLEAIESFEIGEDDEVDVPSILSAIERTIPARNQFVKFVRLIAQYNCGDEIIASLHRFFEACLALLDVERAGYNYNPNRRDPIRFLVGELFLYAVAALLQRERFGAIERLIGPAYYSRSRAQYNQVVRSYWDLYGSLNSEREIQRHLKKVSARAKLLETRNEGSGVPFDSLVQADIILWLRTAPIRATQRAWWYAVTPIYLSNSHVPIEIFARSISRDYLSKVLPLVGATTKEEFIDPTGPWIAQIREWRVGYDDPSLEYVLNLEQLGTRN